MLGADIFTIVWIDPLIIECCYSLLVSLSVIKHICSFLVSMRNLFPSLSGCVGVLKSELTLAGSVELGLGHYYFFNPVTVFLLEYLIPFHSGYLLVGKGLISLLAILLIAFWSFCSTFFLSCSFPLWCDELICFEYFLFWLCASTEELCFVRVTQSHLNLQQPISSWLHTVLHWLLLPHLMLLVWEFISFFSKEIMFCFVHFSELFYFVSVSLISAPILTNTFVF